MEADELRKLRDTWVAGAFPTTGRQQAKAALVIDELIQEVFRLRAASMDTQAARKAEVELGTISGSRPFRETIWDVRKGKPNLKVFEDEVADVLQLTEEANAWRDGDHTSLVEDALDTLLVALQQGDRLTLKHGGYVSLTTFGVLRAVGREAVLEALGQKDGTSDTPISLCADVHYGHRHD